MFSFKIHADRILYLKIVHMKWLLPYQLFLIKLM